MSAVICMTRPTYRIGYLAIGVSEADLGLRARLVVFPRCHRHISSAARAVRRESGEKQSRPRRSARASEDGSAPPG